MPLPRLGQYQLALQHPATAFADPDLKAASVETTPIGLPRVISGGFALTYHLTNGAQDWAVRCFHREASELGRRYQAIGRMIGAAGRGPFVPVEYLERGVSVDGGWYPVTKMPWLRAVPLNRYIETHLDARSLRRLTEQFRALVARLEALGVAHGDLQHGNILVDAFGNLTLVDYDGMYVPALAGLPANESGHVNYQHRRRSGQFDPLLDRFSAALIFTALSALAADPALWHRYSNGENLLFRRPDCDDPGRSPLFAELRSMPSITPLVERLAGLCDAEYAALPTLTKFIEGGHRPPIPAATPVAPAAAGSGREVLGAADTERLLHHEGDIVTVVGRIVAARQRWSRQRRPYVVIHFGPIRSNALTLELWSQALNFFMPAGQVIGAYNGHWVRVSGLIAISHRRDAARTPRPVITLELPSAIVLVAEEEAVRLLSTGDAVPWYRANRRARPAALRPVTAETAAALNRLYRPPPADRVPRAATTTPRKARSRETVKKPSRRGGPPNQSGGEWWRGILARSPGGAAAGSLAALGKGVVAQLLKVTVALATLATVTTLLALRLLW